MTEPFTLSVFYKGQTMDFPARLVVYGYSHQFKVTINQQEVSFEPDEEGQYRAVVAPGHGNNAPAAPERDLLLLIQQQITALRQ